MDTGKRKELPNPREDANPLSVLLFWWTVNLFKKGYQKQLTEEDLYDPLRSDTSEHLGDKLQAQWERQLEIQRCSGGQKKPSLMIAILRAFSWEYIKLGLLQVVNDLGIRLTMPMMLGMLLSYFKKPSDITKEEAYIYAGVIVALTMASMILFNHFTLGAFHVGMRVRAACCSVIYRKALRLSKTALGETASGKVVNLLSNDVSRFDMVSIFLHSMWLAPLSACFVIYLLYQEAGYAGLIGVLIVFLIVPLQSYTGKLTSKYRLRTAVKTDERIRLMDEIISGINVIKMYAWEKPFAQLIRMARKAELSVVIKTSYIRGLFMTFQITTTRIALYATLMSVVAFNYQLSVDKVFVYQSFFSVLAFSMAMQYVRGVAEIAETLVSIKRLQNFLLLEEFQECVNKRNTEDDGATEGIRLHQVCAKWNPSSEDKTLNNLCFRVKKGSLVVIIGQVGSGKSSLLQAVLGELPITGGSLTMSGKVSYASQEPWVFGSTVRQNIIFGRPFDRRRYNKVVQVCALSQDFKQFPFGDLTVVGERGSSLSGGQKARINLARAIYNESDLYLLDDPLSAVDTHVGKHLFNECVVGYLKGKTRILVTHQLQFLREADLILILNNGEIVLQGTFTDLISTHAHSAHLFGVVDNTFEDECLSDEKPESERIANGEINSLLRQLSQISTKSKSSDAAPETEVPSAATNLEMSSKGTLNQSVYLGYLRSGTNSYVVFLMGIMFLMAQTAASVSDWWISYWVTQEELRQKYNNVPLNMSLNSNYFSYSKNSSSSSEAFHSLLSTSTYMYIYTGIILFLFFVTITRSFAFYTLCMKCSSSLHTSMFNSVTRTNMRFFDTNPSGRIMNRFSKDIGSVDELLPKVILDATQIVLWMVGCLIVTVTTNLYFLIPIFVLGILFFYIRKIYLKTSKNIKRLEGITKSPVFTHLNATLQGLTTIRAYGAQDILRKEFDKHQDLHSSSWYMFIATSQAFGFALDLMCFVFIAIVTFSFLFLEETFGGSVGLAITQSMALVGMMQWGIRQSAEVANQMMSVERVLEYSNLPEEPKLITPSDIIVPNNWPSEGRIEFHRVFLKYDESSPAVLTELSLTVLPQEKVGIVGRTGAGKSSLIAALFRLAHIEGSIKIDCLDTGIIGLQELRRRISIIPQDPVLFSGSLRRNLDPFNQYPDYILWKALDQVELKEAISGAVGLDMHVADHGSNFSVGQRQLICLARAIIRNNKILVLDEATANVDPHTDSLIQKTIRLQFSGCTVLTVAHRLNTIMDSDKVLVMESGRMIEFDHPHLLLQNKNGHFYKMVQETGRSMAEQLFAIAEECYRKKLKDKNVNISFK